MKNTAFMKIKSWFQTHGALLTFNVLLLLVTMLLLWLKPSDHLRDYEIPRSRFPAVDCHGSQMASKSFDFRGNADSFEIYVEAKEEAFDGAFEVRLLDVDGNCLQGWKAAVRQDQKGEQGKGQWFSYEVDQNLLQKGKEYEIIVRASDLTAEASVLVSGFATYRDCGNGFALIALILLFVTANFWWLNDSKPIEKWAPGVLLGTGLIMLFIMAPASHPDEEAHYYSSLKLSNLMMGKSNLNEIEEEYVAKLERHKNSNVSFMKLIKGFWAKDVSTKDALITKPSYTVDQPTSYLAQALGMTLGRLLGCNYFQVYELARFFNLLSYVCMVWLAIWLVPYNKRLLLMVGIMPMAMHQATSLSYDVVVNGMAFVFFAWLMKLICEKQLFTWKQAIVSACLLGLFGPVKVVYCLLGLLVFMLPVKQFKNLADYLLKCSFVFLFSIGFTLVTRWSYLMEHLNGTAFGFSNPYYDVTFVMEKPFQFLRLIAYTLYHYVWQYTRQAVGSHLAGVNVYISTGWIIAYLIVLTVHATYQEEAPVLRVRQMVVAVGTAMITVVGVMAALALAFTPRGCDIVVGVQGRYFIPAIVPVLFCLATDKIPIKINKKYVTCLIWFVFADVIVEVMNQIVY